MNRTLRTRRTIAAAVLVALLTTLVVAVTTNRATAAPLHPEFEMFDLINKERAAIGRKPLKMSLHVSDVAEAWSNKMASEGRLYHNPNYVAQIQPYAPHWKLMAENVGYGPSIQKLHSALMASPGHRANILDPDVNYVGIGVVYRNGTYWITQNFVGTTDVMTEATRPAPTTPTTKPPSTTTPKPSGFRDVPARAYYANAVNWAAKTKVTTGCAPDRFCPNEPVTRAQMVTLLWRYLGSPKAARPAPFKDVPRNSYYARAVDWAYSAGVTTGCAPDRFCPNEGVLRAQMVTFLYRAKGSPSVSAVNKFRDVPSNTYYAKAVTWADRTGVTTGCASNRFCPKEVTTRAQGITFIYRYAGSPRP